MRFGFSEVSSCCAAATGRAKKWLSDFRRVRKHLGYRIKSGPKRIKERIWDPLWILGTKPQNR